MSKLTIGTAAGASFSHDASAMNLLTKRSAGRRGKTSWRRTSNHKISMIGSKVKRKSLPTYRKHPIPCGKYARQVLFDGWTGLTVKQRHLS